MNRPYRQGVAALLLLPEHPGHIFAALRIDIPGAWQMPQGGVEAGESAADALARELAEETSITPQYTQPIDHPTVTATYNFPPEVANTVCRGRYRGQTITVAALRFTGPAAVINLQTAHPEFCEWKPMLPADLITIAPDFKKPFYREVFNHFAPLLSSV